jgi:hypothetical protein
VPGSPARDALEQVRSEHLADAERRGDLFLKTGIVSAALYWLAQDAAAELALHIEDCRRDWPSDVFLMPDYWLLVAELQRDVYVGDGRAGLARVEAAWRALKRCERDGLVMQREAARYCLGQVLGGEAGQFSQHRALAVFAQLGVKTLCA